MRLFVYEDICGGGCANQRISQSLKTEALAMLLAVLEDFSKIDTAPDGTRLEIITHWDERFEHPPFRHLNHLRVIGVNSSIDAEKNFQATLETCDAALIVAPESENRLQTLCQRVALADCISFNSAPDAIQLCGDKLALARHLEQYGILTTPTHTAAEQFPDAEFLVIKPRFGAGSMGIQTIRSSEGPTIPPDENRIVQPLVRGEHYSVGCFYHSKTDDLNCLPVAKQHLSTDGHFQYQGGSLPAKQIEQQQVTEMARRIVDSIVGLHGYFGIDFIVSGNGQLVLVEVNPRLTTSYVGYRASTSTNLAELFFSPPRFRKIEWGDHVMFSPSGRVEELGSGGVGNRFVKSGICFGTVLDGDRR